MVDLHINQERQGPGSKEATQLALDLSGLASMKNPKIADIGCGTGASSLQLAQTTSAQITAVDFLPEFIKSLDAKAQVHSLGGSINTLVGSMEKLTFDKGELDAIWSEGAIYNMGFKNGVTSWKPFLKPGGTLVVSEITWLTSSRPVSLEEYWKSEYPEIANASSKLKVLEETGYSPVAYFVLPNNCWLENYYDPLEKELPHFLERHDHSKQALEIASAEQKERELYQEFQSYYSYGVYIAKKNEDP